MAALPAPRHLLAPVVLCLAFAACSLDPQPEPPLDLDPGKQNDAGSSAGGAAGMSAGGAAGTSAGGAAGTSAGGAGTAGSGLFDAGDPDGTIDAPAEGGGWEDADGADVDAEAGEDAPLEAAPNADSGDDSSPLDAEASD